MSFHRDSKGYTLVELLIALVVGMILIAATFATYIVQNRSYVSQERVSEINTQPKIAQGIVLNDTRSAGFGIPADLNDDPINTKTSIINAVDSTTSTDSITIVGGFRCVGTLAGNAALGVISINIQYSNPGTSCDNPSGGTGPNTSDRRYLSIDGIDFMEVSSCTITNSRCSASNPITLDRKLPNNVPAGRPIYLVEDVTYCVNGTTLRRIRRNANTGTCQGISTSKTETIADNVEDLQFAFGEDLNGDGFLDSSDDQNGDGVFDGNDFINWGSVGTPSNIRAVRINILARTDAEDPDFMGQGNPPSNIENRSHTATNDGYRRRWWQGVVTLRNR